MFSYIAESDFSKNERKKIEMIAIGFRSKASIYLYLCNLKNVKSYIYSFARSSSTRLRGMILRVELWALSQNAIFI